MMFTLPCHIPETNEAIEGLMFKFGNAKRRTYSMKQKGIDRLEALKNLTRTGLHSRYVQTAYQMIEKLEPHVTFGGLKLQRLREKGKITREEYRRRRNNLLACYGQAHNKGNLCLRVEGNKLRVNIAPRKWVEVPLQIPSRYEQYREFLDGSKPYRVVVKRRDDGKGYDVNISLDIDVRELETTRVMALDLNAGHIDFAVVEKQDLEPTAVGKINCHELLTSRKGKNELVVHKTVNKIRNVAKHYKAEVVAGKLRTLTAGGKRANRKVHRMSQFELRQVMRYKLPLNGIKFKERSEACTSKVGRAIFSKPMGLDVHKASAYAFAVKVIDYPHFKFLRGVSANEGDGSPSAGLSGGSGLTAPRQAGLACDEARAEATPQFMGWGGGTEPFQNTILQVKV